MEALSLPRKAVAGLSFDPAAHAYTFNSRPVVGVTSLLQHLHSFAGVPLDVLEAARERGTAVHAACQFLDENDLDEEQLAIDNRLVSGYLQGWKKFVAEFAPAWTAIERPVYHASFRYAGTPDRFAVIAGEPWCLDIKTAIASHPVMGLQTAAYSYAAGMPRARRATVHLGAEGTFRLKEWIDPNDWPVFASLVTLHHFKERTQ